MKYFKRDKKLDAKVIEITKAKARDSLTGYWQEKILDEIFCYEYKFRLDTPYLIVWTMDENGKIPMDGFYGILL